MNRRKGFTLVELVVVVMILGILAAVAAPKFLDTSATATDNALRHSLTIIRDAIELYAAENAGALPGADGVAATFISDLDPYLRGQGTFPKCPVGAKNAQVRMSAGPGAITGEANPTDAWHYAYETGQFIINYNVATKSDATVNYDDL